MPLSQTVLGTAHWPEALSAPESPSFLWKEVGGKGMNVARWGIPGGWRLDQLGIQLASCPLV